MKTSFVNSRGLQGVSSSFVRGHARVAVAPPRSRAVRQGRYIRADGESQRSSSWDVGRFIKTVAFFNKPPSPGELISGIISQPARVLAALTGGNVEEKKQVILPLFGSTATQKSSVRAPSSMPEGGTVLVSGATGGVGRRVVQRLLQRGRSVRALVRDVDKAKRLLGDLEGAAGSTLELVPADITQPATLQPDMFVGITQAILATAVTVNPKEGDNISRDKYMQGIKFYDPEIIGDTPETVEYKGVQNLVTVLREHVGLRAGQLLFAPDGSQQIGGATQGPLSEFGSLDDVVMGGMSESGFSIRQGAGESGGAAGVFSGIVTTENNGGFASVRTRNLNPKADLGAYEGIALRVKGNGLRFKCIIRTDEGWDAVGFCQSFDTKDNEWQTVNLPFSDFRPVFRARTLTDGSRLDPSRIASIQLMLSKFEYDGELNPAFPSSSPSPFQLPITEIRAYLPEPLQPRIVHISSCATTRVDRPGVDKSEQIKVVQSNDALGGLLTYKLKGEDVVRNSGVPFTVVRSCALTEEPPGAELELDQGDNITGKMSREDLADLCVALLDTPAAVDTTFEIKSKVPTNQTFELDPAVPPQPRDWQALLAEANLKQGVTGKTINGVYTGREPEPE